MPERGRKTRPLSVSNFNETSHKAPPKQCQIIPYSGLFTQPAPPSCRSGHRSDVL